MRINKHDTNGTKPLLGKGELGYDDYVAGGDAGRVYVGTGSENIALAEKSEIDSHAGRTDNPHSVTKAQVGLANVDNTSDANKPISTATQNALNAKVDTSTNQTIGGVKTFSSSPIVPTPTTGTQAANKDYVDTKVDKVTSTDNAVARYDGTTGKLQNSGVTIDDNGNVIAGSLTTTFALGVSRGIYIEPTAPTADSEFRVNGSGSWFTSFSYNTSGTGYGGWRHIDNSYSIKNWVYTAGEGEIQFGTSGAERMRTTSSGNLLVGTPTDNGIDKLQVNGSISYKTQSGRIVGTNLANVYITNTNSHTLTTFGGNIPLMLEIVNAYSGVTCIPIYPFGGSGVKFVWNILNPETGVFVNNIATQDLNLTVTDKGNYPNTYTITLNGGNSHISIKATALNSVFNVYLTTM